MSSKEKSSSKRRKFFEVSGMISFSLLFALIIQIAVLTFDFLEDRVDVGVISVAMLIIIFFLATVASVIDAVRRKITVDRPVKKILDGTEMLASGDLSVEIDIFNPYGKYTKYDMIAENINDMAKKLRRNELISSDFVSGISHEMKTPLAVIKNYAKALKNNDLDEETKEKYLSTVVEATEKLSGLIDSVLKLTKLENSEISVEKQKFKLDEVICDDIIVFDEKIETKGLVLDCDIDEIDLIGDEKLVSLIFSNLLSNAVKFTPSGGAIKISLKEVDGKAEIVVKDSGIGISKEVGARIFDKFYQADKSRREEGNGLGLALVKKAIDVLGGKITVSSEEGKGSKFTVILNGATKRN